MYIQQQPLLQQLLVILFIYFSVAFIFQTVTLVQYILLFEQDEQLLYQRIYYIIDKSFKGLHLSKYLCRWILQVLKNYSTNLYKTTILIIDIMIEY